MTKEGILSMIKRECLKKKTAFGEGEYYMTPELNRTLYLHFKGYSNIGGLEDFTGLRVLWLESNAITKIEGLSTLRELRCLYLQDNLIESMRGLGGTTLPCLDTLNLSGNRIEAVECLSYLPSLTTLIVSKNAVTAEGLAGIREAGEGLSVLDLSENKIRGDGAVGGEVLDLLEGVRNLRVLTLSGGGNTVGSEIPHYRRVMIVRLRELRYLDDMPVTERERRTTEAWGQGGKEAEARERSRIREEEEAAQRRNFEALEALIRGPHPDASDETLPETSAAGSAVEVFDLEGESEVRVESVPEAAARPEGLPDLDDVD